MDAGKTSITTEERALSFVNLEQCSFFSLNQNGLSGPKDALCYMDFYFLVLGVRKTCKLFRFSVITSTGAQTSRIFALLYLRRFGTYLVPIFNSAVFLRG